MPNGIFIFLLFGILRMTSPAGGDGKMGETTTSREEFSSNFHKVIARGTDGNTVDSPLGASTVLSYLLRGCGDEAAALCPSDLGETEWLSEKPNRDATTELRSVNAMFLQNGVRLLESFRTLGRDLYNFSIENVDFGDRVAAARSIDSWVSSSTDGRINALLSPDEINEGTRVVLANALYFNGRWRHPFDARATEERPFHSANGRNYDIPTMFQKSSFFYGRVDALGCRFLEIPYTDGKIDMIVLLPDEIDGLKSLEEKFDWKAVVDAKRSKGPVRLYLPKFKIEGTVDLRSVLIELGFGFAFEETADFGKMSDEPLKVDGIVQKAYIEVDEAGTEAAASTGVRMMMKRSLEMEEKPEEFVVDRAFLVAVRHAASVAPLFLASVRNPIPRVERDEL